MTSKEWTKRIDEQRPFTLTTFTFDDIVADLAASERSDAIHLEALAESERLRAEQAEELADYKAVYEAAREMIVNGVFSDETDKAIDRIEWGRNHEQA